MSLSRFSLMATLALAGIALTPPAFAAEETPIACTTFAVSDWAAPLDEAACRQVRLFGIVPVPANEGVLDRGLRLVAGVGLASIAAADPWASGTAVRAGAGVAGGVMLWTAFTGACPLYMPIGLSTRSGTP